MFLCIIIRDHIRRSSLKTTDAFLYAVNAFFSSPVYEIEYEDEIKAITDSFVSSCTAVRQPIIQIIKTQSEDELLLELSDIAKNLILTNC